MCAMRAMELRSQLYEMHSKLTNQSQCHHRDGLIGRTVGIIWDEFTQAAQLEINPRSN